MTITQPKKIQVPPLNDGRPDEAQMNQWQTHLFDHGYVVIRDALPGEAVEHFRRRVEALPPSFNYKFNAVRLFEQGMDFVALLDNEPVVSLMRHVFGRNTHIVMMQGHRISRGAEFSSWHADELHVERPADVTDDVPYPPIINTINCHYYLVDVPEQLGPTQVVPGSHIACRQPRPDDGDPPHWQGSGPVSLTCRGGDCVLQSAHVWHRGAENVTDRVRLSIVPAYARRFVAQRFWPFLNYNLSRDILDQCTASQRELLGEHEVGPYG